MFDETKQRNIADRKKLSNVVKVGFGGSKRKKRVLENYQKKVIKFLKREDNCRMKPDKRDSSKTEDGRVQNRVLTDYMRNYFKSLCQKTRMLQFHFLVFVE